MKKTSKQYQNQIESNPNTIYWKNKTAPELTFHLQNYN